MTAAGIDWTPLHGVEVTLTERATTWCGVVLPPTATTPPGALRLAPTTSHGPAEPGETATVDPAQWTITPSPSTVDARFLPSRRRTRCPAGLPLYRPDNLPAAVLATRTMLRRQYRRQPAPDQLPIASYLAMHEYTALFAVADTAPMAPLSPKRQAKWDLVRTCARCAATSLLPLGEGPRGRRRYCGRCQEPAAKELWLQRRQTERADTTEWARAVLADNRAVFIHSTWGTIPPLFAARLDGTVLADHDRVYVGHPDYADLHPDIDDCPRPADIIDLVRDLTTHRTISWHIDGLKAIAVNLSRLGHPDLDGFTPHDNDQFGTHYARWLGQPAYPNTAYRHQPPSLMAVRVPTHGRDQFGDALAILREMAAGNPTTNRITTARTHQDPHSQVFDGYWHNYGEHRD